jgi:TonB family protein
VLGKIGRFKLLQKIGEGAFGDVWMAEQEEPVRRRVALKIIKLGMDTSEVVARFEAERQALALMDHPNIARVFDGGATESGRPYFVMELVRGEPITKYCDRLKLSTRERSELFIQVCEAVQHAHQKGVIHRDLKPSNILVMELDGRAITKVIDFGVARAIGHRLIDKTLFTRLGHLVGTPAYMSPEQASLGGLDIDTRSDVYCLGVVFYELLTGRTPLDTQQLLREGYEAMLRTIRENEPPKPSTCLSTLAPGELTAIAQQRRADPQKLNRLFRGELDCIVMKALEKDRNRRYQTASGLASDIQRHLNNEPVIARPPSRLYRLQKIAQRNKGAFAAAIAIILVLVLGAAISAWQAVRATRAELAQVQLRNQAQQSEQKALLALADEAKQRKSAEEATEALSEAVHRFQLLINQCNDVVNKHKKRPPEETQPLQVYQASYNLLTNLIANEPVFSNPMPTYPAQALRSKQEGTVLLRIATDNDGSATSLKVMKSSGSVLLDSHTIEWIRSRWAFPNAERTYFVPIVYQLMN